MHQFNNNLKIHQINNNLKIHQFNNNLKIHQFNNNLKNLTVFKTHTIIFSFFLFSFSFLNLSDVSESLLFYIIDNRLDRSLEVDQSFTLFS
jgi:hypothetical protein